MSRKAAYAALFITVAGISLSLVAYIRTGRTSASSHSPKTRLESHQGDSDRVEAELLLLRSDGFKPKEITRPPGRFLLAVQNYSSEEKISLMLKQESGTSVREVRLGNRQSKLKEFLHLPPGRYVLVETNHPEWVCTINILSR